MAQEDWENNQQLFWTRPAQSHCRWLGSCHCSWALKRGEERKFTPKNPQFHYKRNFWKSAEVYSHFTSKESCQQCTATVFGTNSVRDSRQPLKSCAQFHTKKINKEKLIYGLYRFLSKIIANPLYAPSFPKHSVPSSPTGSSGFLSKRKLSTWKKSSLSLVSFERHLSN